jgi:hypothetical protein
MRLESERKLLELNYKSVEAPDLERERETGLGSI